MLFLFLFIFQHLLGEMSIEELDEKGPKSMMITSITMPRMRRAEGACWVLFMTFFSFSFCSVSYTHLTLPTNSRV